MKKTLLLTTALVGALSIIGSANAEVKIGASVKTNYKSAERTGTEPTASGFSQERQLDFSSSGDLNNGLKYAAGFSLEQDAGESGFDGSENNYVDIISGNTTFTLGNDHILNGDYNIVPRVGEPMSDELSSFAPNGNDSTTTLLGQNDIAYAQTLGTIKEDMGLGVIQKMDIGTVAFNFVPNSGSKAATKDTGVGEANGKDAYEIMFVGGFGVPGLNTAINYSSVSNNGNVQDAELKAFGASYTVGAIRFGAEIAQFEALTGAETDTQELGVVYKINDKASIGFGQTKTDGKDANGVATTADEKIKYVQAGYNLGAIGLGLSYIDASDLGNVPGNDTKAWVFKTATKF
jgi:hypothetical protein